MLSLDAVPEENRLDIGLVARGPGRRLHRRPDRHRPAGRRPDRRPRRLGATGRAAPARRSAAGGLADLAVTGRDGTFTVQGPLRPGLILAGPAQRLAAPLVQIEPRSPTLEQRRANLRLRAQQPGAARSPPRAWSISAQNRFQDLRVAARLIEPGAIAPNLSGRDVQLAMILNGAVRARPASPTS